MPDLENSMSCRPTCPEIGDGPLDAALAASFPASDPVAALEPAAERPAAGRSIRIRTRVQSRALTRKTEEKP